MIPLDREQRYGEAALDGLLAELAGAAEHNRNNTLNAVAYRVGRLVGAGALSMDHATAALEAAGIATGLKPVGVRATVRSGLSAGQRNPAALPDSCSGPPVAPSTPAPSAPCRRPPQDEVEQLWRRSRSVLDDSEVADWLEGRAIPPDQVELHDLARAISPDVPVPQWARCQGVSWTEHHRLVARGWGATGTIESLHARAVGELPDGMAKGLWPAAGSGSARGLVLADGWGRQILAAGKRAAGWSGEVVVAEGLPDFLTWCVAFSDSDITAPAVLGVTAGSWTPEIAARVPDGTRVIIATHHDAAGDRYAVTIANALTPRCEVLRWAA